MALLVPNESGALLKVTTLKVSPAALRFAICERQLLFESEFFEVLAGLAGTNKSETARLCQTEPCVESSGTPQRSAW